MLSFFLQAEVSLLSLANQEVKEMWLPLDAGSARPPGKLHVKVLFNYSEIAKKLQQKVQVEKQLSMKRLQLKKVLQSMRATYGKGR
jgi:hypothetical protein